MINYEEEHLAHHGTKGQRWGVRRFQNSDGSLTAAGKLRYSVGNGERSVSKKVDPKSAAKLKKQQTKEAAKLERLKVKEAAKTEKYKEKLSKKKSPMSNEIRHYFAFLSKKFLRIHDGYFSGKNNLQKVFLICRFFFLFSYALACAYAHESINNGREHLGAAQSK